MDWMGLISPVREKFEISSTGTRKSPEASPIQLTFDISSTGTWEGVLKVRRASFQAKVIETKLLDLDLYLFGISSLKVMPSVLECFSG